MLIVFKFNRPNTSNNKEVSKNADLIGDTLYSDDKEMHSEQRVTLSI